MVRIRPRASGTEGADPGAPTPAAKPALRRRPPSESSESEQVWAPQSAPEPMTTVEDAIGSAAEATPRPPRAERLGRPTPEPATQPTPAPAPAPAPASEPTPPSTPEPTRVHRPAPLVPPAPPAPPVLADEPRKSKDPFALPADAWGAGAATVASVAKPPPGLTPPPGTVPPARSGPLLAPPRRDINLPTAGLIAAAVLLVTALLAAATGLAKDDGDDVAASGSTTSTTAARSSSTTSTTSPGSTTSTTAGSVPTVPNITTGTTPTTSGGPSVTIPRQTGGNGGNGNPGGGPAPTTTAPPTTEPTTPTSSTATTIGANQGMTVTMSTEPAEPVAGKNVNVTITFRDEDAVPTTNCLSVSGDDGVVVESPDCDDPDCGPINPGIAPQGGTRTVTFNHTYPQAGRYTVRATGRSGNPECGNPYASRVSDTFTIDVAAGN